ncbi:MAG: LysE family translocator [Alphaproteobacteria bacterium]|nr:LysE family translocator [Alphaproteobacteria bacterium]
MLLSPNEFALFAALAAVNIVTPGPGVVLTLTNAIQHRARNVFAGIAGVALGTFVVASVSAMGIGAVLMASSAAFTILKYAGAAYLIYLGVKMWRAPPLVIGDHVASTASMARRFAEGFALQISNPNAVLFFIALFPQFIDHHSSSLERGVLLVTFYALLVMMIHSLYALAALKARTWLASSGGGRALNRMSGVAFVIFGVALATSGPRMPR